MLFLTEIHIARCKTHLKIYHFVSNRCCESVYPGFLVFPPRLLQQSVLRSWQGAYTRWASVPSIFGYRLSSRFIQNPPGDLRGFGKTQEGTTSPQEPHMGHDNPSILWKVELIRPFCCSFDHWEKFLAEKGLVWKVTASCYKMVCESFLLYHNSQESRSVGFL